MKSKRYENKEDVKYLFLGADIDVHLYWSIDMRSEGRFALIIDSLYPVPYISESKIDKILDFCMNEEVTNCIRIFPKGWENEFDLTKIPFIEIDKVTVIELYNAIKYDTDIVDYFEAIRNTTERLKLKQIYKEEEVSKLEKELVTSIVVNAFVWKIVNNVTVFVPSPAESEAIDKITNELKWVHAKVHFDKDINKIIFNYKDSNKDYNGSNIIPE